MAHYRHQTMATTAIQDNQCQPTTSQEALGKERPLEMVVTLVLVSPLEALLMTIILLMNLDKEALEMVILARCNVEFAQLIGTWT